MAALMDLAATSPRWRDARPMIAEALERGIADLLAIRAIPGERVVMNAGSTRVAAAIDDELRVWDLTTRHERRFPLPSCASTPCRSPVAISPDGGRVAIAREGVRIWAFDDPDVSPTVLDGWDVALPEDGSVIVARGEDIERQAVSVAADGTETVLLDHMSQLLFDPDGRMVLGGDARDTAFVWRDGVVQQTSFRGENRPDHAVAIDDGNVFWVNVSGQVVRWDVANGTTETLAAVAAGSGAEILVAGDTLLVQADGLLQFIDLHATGSARTLRTGIESVSGLAAWPTPNSAVLENTKLLAVDPGGVSVMVDDDTSWELAWRADGAQLVALGTEVRVWKEAQRRTGFLTVNAKGPSGLGAHPGVVSNAAGTHVLVWADGDLDVFRRDGLTLEYVGSPPITPPEGCTQCLAPDGLHLVSWSGSAVVLRDLDGAARELGRVDGEPKVLRFAADGSIVAVAMLADGVSIRRWNADGSGGEIVCQESERWRWMQMSGDGLVVREHEGSTLCRLTDGSVDQMPGAEAIEFASGSRDGSTWAGHDTLTGELVAFDAAGRHAIAIAGPVVEVLISPDGDYAVARRKTDTVVWSIGDGAMRSLPINTAWGGVVFGPGDRVVLSDDEAHLVDLATGASRVLSSTAHPHWIFDDGAVLGTDYDGVRIWLDDLPFDPASLSAIVKSATNARLDESGELSIGTP